TGPRCPPCLIPAGVPSMLRACSSVTALTAMIVALPATVKAAGDVEWLNRVCVGSYSSPSADEQAFCLTYISGVADLMLANCRIARQRLSAGGLKNNDDRQAILSVSSDASTVGLAGMKHAFIDWANKRPDRWKQPMVAGVMEALREKLQ